MVMSAIQNQTLLANAVLDIPIRRGTTMHALTFAHTGSSNAEVTVYAVPQKRPESSKSTYIFFHTTVTADTTTVFSISDTQINLDGFSLQVETDSNGAGNIMLTVLGA